jgi:hypothetical protein
MIVVLARAETNQSHPTYAGGEIHAVLGVVRASDPSAAIAALKRQLSDSGFDEVEIIDVEKARFWRASTTATFWRALATGIAISVYDHDERTGTPGIRR